MPDVVETAEVKATDIDTAQGEIPEIEVSEVEIPEDEAVEEATPEDEAVEVSDAETFEVETSDVEVSDIDIAEVDTVEIAPVDVEATEEAAEVAESTDADEPVEAKPASPYDLPGDWYVIHSYSGYENKVKANLETRIQSMHMGDRIFEVHIPMEDVVEFKAGKKVTVPKKVFPGYILVRMTLDDDSWYAVRNTPGVTGFVAGNAQKPTPLSRREVERFLGVQEEEERAKPRFKPDWEVGEQVRVVTGPFADFNGVIEDMNVDQQKVVVLVNIFGRDTPVELGFEDIQKS